MIPGNFHWFENQRKTENFRRIAGFQPHLRWSLQQSLRRPTWGSRSQGLTLDQAWCAWRQKKSNFRIFKKSHCLLSAVQKGTMFSQREPSLVNRPSLWKYSIDFMWDYLSERRDISLVQQAPEFQFSINFDPKKWFSKELQTCWVDAPGLLHCLRLWFPCNRHRRRFAPGKNVTFDHLTFRFSETINYLLALCYIFIPGIRILTPKIVIPAAAAAR